MRVLCQCNGYLPDVIGGGEVFVARLFEALQAKGHETLVLAPCIAGGPPERRRLNGVDIVKLPFVEAMASNRLDEMARIQRDVNAIVRDFRPDVLHLNPMIAMATFFFQRRGALAEIPRVLTLHSPIVPSNVDGLLHRIARDADIVVAVSHSLAEDAAAAMPDIRGKLSTILNALPFPEEPPAPIPTGKPTFLCCGRMVEDKGIDVAIEAFAVLEHNDIAARLVIVGNGPHRPAFEARARGLGVDVEFRGWVLPEDMPRTIGEASAVLAPSRWKEPFGFVALEAAQMGRPVIASRVGGLAEIVEDGRTGLLVPPNDAEALAGAMTELALAPERAAQMGRAARSRARQVFDFPSFVSAYENAYATAQARAAQLQAV